ncbi:MAG: hypothetical protein O3A59_02670 [Nitrospirae bacterium]|nr:hypothetical protein [Nitrospirota bacterium]
MILLARPGEKNNQLVSYDRIENSIAGAVMFPHLIQAFSPFDFLPVTKIPKGSPTNTTQQLGLSGLILEA